MKPSTMLLEIVCVLETNWEALENVTWFPYGNDDGTATFHLMLATIT